MLKKLSEIFRSDRKYIYHFIHIPKNGGSSVRDVLKTRGDVSMSRPFHYRYIDVVEDLGRDLKYFCIVRNPWARTASRFAFGKQNAAKWHKDDPRRTYILNATFEDYVRDQKIFDIPGRSGQPWMGPLSSWLNQLEWVCDERDSIECDCLRLEHIDKDLSIYFDTKIVVPRKNETKSAYDYRSLYTDELIEIIANTFSKDIEYFGFTFDGAATRNTFGQQ